MSILSEARSKAKASLPPPEAPFLDKAYLAISGERFSLVSAKRTTSEHFKNERYEVLVLMEKPTVAYNARADVKEPRMRGIITLTLNSYRSEIFKELARELCWDLEKGETETGELYGPCILTKEGKYYDIIDAVLE